uniref:UGT79B108 n=1 Tax=Codariocalyx motorius TaxID=1205713 RepID=A0AA51VJG2_9FABA|nr:UGT79B108 [Codariocalyx motorius]
MKSSRLKPLILRKKANTKKLVPIFKKTMDAGHMKMHIAMYPWLAMGHIIPYLHLANKLAERGHKVSFIIPKRTKTKLEHLNQYPQLLNFIPITLPQVDGLPPHAETTFDIPFSSGSLLQIAVDRTEKDIELLLLDLKPQIFFFDFQSWIPNLTRGLGIKSVHYNVINMIAIAYLESMEKMCQEKNLVREEQNLMSVPDEFPDHSIKLYAHEVRVLASLMTAVYGIGDRVFLMDNIRTGIRLADAVGYKGCRELEGPYADFLETYFGKPFLLSGHALPEPPNSTLEDKWSQWLSGFKPGSVVYCAFGTESRLPQDQFMELLLGLELTGFPFLAALKAPIGFDSVEEAIPEEFKERIKGRGIVHGGWVQQTLILEHSSIGCFITHCGANAFLEALLNNNQIVALPNFYFDQIIIARMISTSLKVGVEVEKGQEDGLFTKESVCKAVKTVMDDESEVAGEVRANHLKLRNILLTKDLEKTYIDEFCNKLQKLLE